MPRTYMLVGSYYQHQDYHKLRGYLESLDRDLDDYAVVSNEQRGATKKAQGFSATYGRLLAHAFSDPDCRYAWLLNDDALPIGRCLERSQMIIEDDPTIGIVFPVEAWMEDGRWTTMLPVTGAKANIFDAIQTGEPCLEQIYAGFACACIRREAWEAVGPLDENIGRGYSEDLDFGLRCWKAGFRVVNHRRQWFSHKRGATFNALIEENKFGQNEPYEAAQRVKEKWPEVGLWEKPFDEIMTILRKWYADARR